MHLRVNGTRHQIPPAWQAESLLDVLRDHLQLTAAKYGCGVGLCGACTVLQDGRAVRSCITPVAEATGDDIVTLEGLGGPDADHPLQRAWIAEAVPQCGYCQAGQIMSAAALLRETPQPTETEIDAAMDGNLCRCGTYGRIRRAIRRAAEGA
ncbi:(2Fe-2S)-binding protein [Marinibaculum pumilum]|uniref:(2Fe-2S)-binding protein n=1 Tax=Marinibaculum pumilum TaxID=1766165 RepID=A0ABV7L7W5_9PROT